MNDVVQSEDVLIIDLDTLPVATWVKFLKAHNRSGKLKLAIILFSPSLQTDRVVHVLEKVGQSQRFCVLKKCRYSSVSRSSELNLRYKWDERKA